MELQGQLTQRGEALLAAALSGGTPLTYTRAAAGSGATDISATALAEERQSLTLGTPKTTEQGILLPVTLIVAQAEQAYVLAEVGIYAQDEDGESLYAVYRLTPAFAVNPADSLSIRLELEEVFAEATEVSVTSAGILTFEDLERLKGVPSGLAELDKAGVVPNNQLSDQPGWLSTSGAGGHNSIYRGKYLGDSVTAEQYAAIGDGTFDDMYIGDYWTIGGVTYRIASFDYYLRSGDTDMTTHHVTLVPDAPMYTHCMNDTNVTTGGYVGSKMYTTGLADAKTIINNAFGSAHILTHRKFLCNAVNNGKPSGCSWYDSTVELMTEQNVYGGKVLGVSNDGSTVPFLYTVDKSQYPLFAFRPDLISRNISFWLSDVASAILFASVGGGGHAASGGASSALGVRPTFSIQA